jgi:hypothetical protein
MISALNFKIGGGGCTCDIIDWVNNVELPKYEVNN